MYLRQCRSHSQTPAALRCLCGSDDHPVNAQFHQVGGQKRGNGLGAGNSVRYSRFYLIKPFYFDRNGFTVASTDPLALTESRGMWDDAHGGRSGPPGKGYSKLPCSSWISEASLFVSSGVFSSHPLMVSLLSGSGRSYGPMST
jgi:hypothetical protein